MSEDTAMEAALKDYLGFAYRPPSEDEETVGVLGRTIWNAAWHARGAHDAARIAELERELDAHISIAQQARAEYSQAKADLAAERAARERQGELLSALRMASESLACFVFAFLQGRNLPHSHDETMEIIEKIDAESTS